MVLKNANIANTITVSGIGWKIQGWNGAAVSDGLLLCATYHSAGCGRVGDSVLSRVMTDNRRRRMQGGLIGLESCKIIGYSVRGLVQLHIAYGQGHSVVVSARQAEWVLAVVDHSKER